MQYLTGEAPISNFDTYRPTFPLTKVLGRSDREEAKPRFASSIFLT
jgi:hypothetical protein